MAMEMQRRRFRFSTASCALLIALFGASAASAQEREPAPGESRTIESEPKRDMETAIYETWKNILPKVTEEIDPGEEADSPMPAPENVGEVEYIPPVSPDVENPTAVMSASNPMVAPECRAQVEELHRAAYANLKEVDDVVAEAEIRAHYEELRAMMMQGAELTPGAIFRHIAECGEFCFPRKVFLTSCHVHAVSGAARREIVFFGFDRTDVDPRYDGVILSVAEEVRGDPDKKLLVIGRASRPGTDDYNVRLSHVRAVQVIDRLKAGGLSDDRITYMTIGEYAPNIDRDLLGTYKLESALSNVRAASGEDEFNQLNQSVLMVVYDAEEDGAHGGEGHDHAGDAHDYGPGDETTSPLR